jgi:general secretion pathway protein G
MKKTLQSTSGFTLIEVLVTIAILGFLIAMSIANYVPSLQRGRDSKRKNDIRQIGNAAELYFADKETYPMGDANGNILGCGALGTAICGWGSPFTAGTTIYMSQLPKDPVSSQQFYYVSDGTYYQIYTHLEYSKDSDITTTYAGKCVGSTANTCNYGIASTNKTP